jgi:serine phosphatase RsbU (regulator of sigma subunit)
MNLQASIRDDTDRTRVNSLKTQSRIEILQRCSFLQGLPQDVLQAMADEARLLDAAEGETLMQKGDSGSTMYFITSGRVRVHDREVVLAHLEQGEVFGEMAVLDSESRSASITAERDTMLLSLEREAFWRAISSRPDAFKIIIRSVMQRERSIVQDVTSRTEQLLAYEKELEIGRRIQADFLPEAVPEVEGWEIASWFEAAREVAGDFFDVFKLKSSDHLALVIGDVCDKGVGAALFMTLFRSLIRASCLNQAGVLSESGAAARSNSDILLASIETTNSYIATTHSKSSMFASVFAALLDPDSGKMLYINAGHESPVIFRAGGETEILEVTGGVLGLFPWASFTVASAQLEPGDLMFAYTDGINEAKDLQGNQFGDERIVKPGTRIDGDGASDFLEAMMRRVRDFRGEAAQSDDITMLAVRNRSTPSSG